MVACALPQLKAATMSSVCQVQIAASDLIGREQKGVGTLETNQLGRLSS